MQLCVFVRATVPTWGVTCRDNGLCNDGCSRLHLRRARYGLRYHSLGKENRIIDKREMTLNVEGERGYHSDGLDTNVSS